MLETIVIGLVILSALVFGFWQYLAKPDNNARDKRKSKKKNFYSRFECFMENHVVVWFYSDAFRKIFL